MLFALKFSTVPKGFKRERIIMKFEPHGARSFCQRPGMSQYLKSGNLIGKACTYSAIWSHSARVVALDSMDLSAVKVGRRHGCVLCGSAPA